MTTTEPNMPDSLDDGVAQRLTWERSLVAYNYATESENRIHADDVAAQFGFKGGLVPGIGDYAYLARVAHDALGDDWLAAGTMEAKFIKPVYDGDTVRAVATTESADTQAVELSLFDSAGTLCAVGKAASGPSPSLFEGSLEPAELPELEERPPARLKNLPPATCFGCQVLDAEATRERHREMPERFVEDGPFQTTAGEPRLHPAFLPDVGNDILVRNTLLGPWIHTGSRVLHLAPLRPGAELEVRARVADGWERKGRETVELEVGVYDGETCCAQIVHTAIIHLGV